MFQMFINDEEVVCDKGFTITEEMLSTSSTILNNCFPKAWDDDHNYTDKFYYPLDYSKCKILKDNNLIFAGVVKNTGNISLNPRYPHFCSLEILDFKTFLSEGETLDFVISNKTVTEAIEMVIDTIKDYGFEIGVIDIFGADDVIGAYSTLNKTAYDVFQYIADITQSKWFTRMIDEDTIAIDFYDPTLMPQGTPIEYTMDWFEENHVNDLSYSYGTRDYRNKQVMLSDEVYGSIDYNEIIIADGYSRTFYTSANIGTLKSVLVGGETKTFATNDEKDLGVDADFYYTPGKNQIDSNDSQDIISAGIQITISYTPLVQGRELIYDNDEINRLKSQLNRKGVIARYENRNDVLSSEELQKVGQAYMKFKGSAEITLTLVTDNVDLYKVGDVVYFDAPLDELKTDYMVKKKETKIITDNTQVYVWYTYSLVSNFNSESAINYFDNQRSKNSGNISQGEYIARNIDIENTALIIFDNLTITESELSSNVLDSELEVEL